MALERLDERLIDMAELAIIDAVKNCDSDRIKKFFREAIPNALRDLLSSIIDSNTRTCGALKAAVDQILEAKTLARGVAK